MNEVEFDQAFSNFLDDAQYERATGMVFELVSTAFAAGWKAAMDSDLKHVMDAAER